MLFGWQGFLTASVDQACFLHKRHTCSHPFWRTKKRKRSQMRIRCLRLLRKHSSWRAPPSKDRSQPTSHFPPSCALFQSYNINSMPTSLGSNVIARHHQICYVRQSHITRPRSLCPPQKPPCLSRYFVKMDFPLKEGRSWGMASGA